MGFRVRKKLRRKEDPNVIGGIMGPIDEATYCLTSRDTLLKMHVSSRAHEAEAACIMMAWGYKIDSQNEVYHFKGTYQHAAKAEL